MAGCKIKASFCDEFKVLAGSRLYQVLARRSFCIASGSVIGDPDVGHCNCIEGQIYEAAQRPNVDFWRHYNILLHLNKLLCLNPKLHLIPRVSTTYIAQSCSRRFPSSVDKTNFGYPTKIASAHRYQRRTPPRLVLHLDIQHFLRLTRRFPNRHDRWSASP